MLWILQRDSTIIIISFDLKIILYMFCHLPTDGDWGWKGQFMENKKGYIIKLKNFLFTVWTPTQPRVLCIYTISFCQFFRKRLNPHKTKFLLYGEKMKFSICRDPLSFSFLCKRVGKLGAYERLPYKYLISPFANEI